MLRAYPRSSNSFENDQAGVGFSVEQRKPIAGKTHMIVGSPGHPEPQLGPRLFIVMDNDLSVLNDMAVAVCRPRKPWAVTGECRCNRFDSSPTGNPEHTPDRRFADRVNIFEMEKLPASRRRLKQYQVFPGGAYRQGSNDRISAAFTFTRQAGTGCQNQN